MGIKQDWFERQVEALAKAFVGAIFGKEKLEELFEKYEAVLTEETLDEDILERMLKNHIENGKLCDAENLLFDSLEEKATPQKIIVGLNFYNKLNEFDENYLKQHYFSKEEIKDGVEELKNYV